MSVIINTMLTPLCYAAKMGHKAALKILIDNKTDLDRIVVDEEHGLDCTALTYAVHDNQYETVKMLVDAGADVNRSGPILKLAPLGMATIKGYLKMIEYLIRKGAIIDNESFQGQTALILAIENNYPKIIKILVDAGANVNHVTEKSVTPLFYAVHHDRCECVRLLIESGANINAKDGNDMPVLFHAIEKNSIQMMTLLIQSGVDLDVTHEGCAILWCVLREEQYDIMKMMIKAGANTDIYIEGVSLMRMLCMCGRRDIVECIVDQMKQ